MLYTLGIGSAVALAAAVITVICDQFPQFRYWMVTLAICSAGFLVGLIYITPVSKPKHLETITPSFSLLFESYHHCFHYISQEINETS
jgi:ABC-type Fe3+-siderophore transport system permease subunit